MANNLFRGARPKFQMLLTLSGWCPKCGASLVMEYASNPGHYQGKMLSVVITCADRCDKSNLEPACGPAEPNAGQSHWWLDEDDITGELEAIIQSLPRGEAELARILNSTTARLNGAWQKTAGAVS
ncbi:MAG: hypothetical protein BZY80_03035 [SAR202 cluster bacterium Io17-Chloro-G2]|nr:MAG: hypothetical protein BZY80_03035 [SAR202 cluster bacterium Io17-Chloro-G2]